MTGRVEPASKVTRSFYPVHCQIVNGDTQIETKGKALQCLMGNKAVL